MAVEGDKIEYRDLISPDNSINELISQLEQLNRSYGVMLNAVRAGAERIVQSMKQASGATSEGRAKIDEATASASRLKRAQDELAFALTETGQKVAWLKAQTSDANKATVEQQRTAKMLAGSYDALKQELNENIRLWKSLSDVEREDAAMGGQVLSTITSLNSKLAELDSQVKPVVESMTRLQKAERELAFLQSEEGKQLMKVNAQIRELKSEYSGQKNEVDALTRAKQALEKAQSEENREIQRLKQLTEEANKVAKLEVQLANSKEGSYNRLSAQYQLNKIALNKMSSEERHLTKEGQNLEKQTEKLYKEMVLLQEATGDHRLSVGNYAKAWNGLGMSVNQIVRELPSAAMGLNTFILAISNNVPILIDEIQRVKAANEIALKQGKPTQNVLKTITSALFSWQTALIIGITVLTMHGEAIVEWVGNLFSGGKAALSATKATKALNKELENQSDEYGKNVTAFKKLAKSWKALPVDERAEAVNAYAKALENLGLKAKDINSIEELFNNKTQDVLNAFRARAKAAAAMALAEKKYAEAFELEENLNAGDYSFMGEFAEFLVSGFGLYEVTTPDLTANAKETIKQAEQANAAILRKQGDQFFDMSTGYAQEEQEWLGAFALEDPTAGGKSLNLVQRLGQQRLKILEKHEKSVTRLKESEAEERTEKEIDARKAENRQLRVLYDQNEQLLKANSKAEQGEFTLRGKKYEALTEAQVAEVQDSNAKILEIITNNNSAIAKEQYELELKLQSQSLTSQRKTVQLRLDTVKKGTEEELKLRLQALDIERKQALVNNALVDPSARVADTDINKSFEAKKLLLLGERELEAFEQTQALEAAKFQTVKRTSEEIESFEIRQEGLLWSKKISLAKQGMLNWSDTQIAEAEEYLKKLMVEHAEVLLEIQAREIEIQQETIDLRLEAVKKGSEEEINLRLQALENERKLALIANSLLPESQRQSEDVINSAFIAKQLQLLGELDLTAFEERQKTEEESFNATKHTEREKTIFMLQQERDRWKYLITLAEQGSLQWSDEQIKAAKAAVKGIDNKLGDITGVKGVIGDIADKGLGGALLSSLGFDEESIQAFNEATDTIISNLQSIMEAEIQLAEASVEAAQERADSAKSALDAEIEARNKGYANNVATARKEYEQEKKRVAEKQKLLQQAQRRQEALDTATQTSSLITASANIWKSMSDYGIMGPALAIAAIAGMWASFAASKVKARQVTAAEQEYGEGGLEFLEGGSHASGNDIDLATRNRRGKNMRAEGGEALAIINKRNTKRYRKQLPGIIESLNKGIFEDKYLRAFDAGENVMLNIASTQKAVDLTKLENYTEKISKQGEIQRFNLSNGSILVVNKNVRRIIKL